LKGFASPEKTKKALLAGYKRIEWICKLFINFKHKKGAAKIQKNDETPKAVCSSKQNVL